MENTMKKLTSCLVLIFYGFTMVAETLQITLTQETFLKDKEQALGDVLFQQKTLSFSGTLAVEQLNGTQRIKINWTKVNGKSAPSEFLSQFKTQSQELPRGFKFNITGDFESLNDPSLAVAVVDEVEDSGVSDSSVPSASNSAPKESQGLTDSADNPDAATATSPVSIPNQQDMTQNQGTQSTPERSFQKEKQEEKNDDDEKDTPEQQEEKRNDATAIDTLTETTHETCDAQITDVAYITRKQKVLSYSSGKKVRQECQNDRTFALLETFQGCSPRHDFQNKRTIMQKKKYYVSDAGSRVDIVNCTDSKIIYPHLQAVFDCTPVFDAGQQRAYTTKKTYYVDGTGSIQTITDCRMASDDFQTFTQNDYLIEYSDKDRIDHANKVVYRRMRHYIKVGDQKKVIGSWQDDTAKPMPIVREYDKCSYFHNKQAQKSYRQYADVYYKNGQRQVVIACQKDPNNYFAHISDSKYCDPMVNNRKMVLRKSVYFFDQNGQRKNVEDCKVSSVEHDLTPADIQKDFSVCKAHLDFAAKRAYPKYREFVQIKESKTYISNCQKDSNFFDMVETDQGCSPRFDFNQMQAIIKKRLKYNDSQKDVFVSACLETFRRYVLKNDAAMCRDRLSEDKMSIIKFQAVVYTDDKGVKKIAQTCQSTHHSTPIDPKKLVKKYTCADLYDVPNMKVYRQYKNYLNLGGKEEEISSCLVDKSQFYPIERDFADCKNDYNTFTMKAILKNKLFYNTGIEKRYISACLTSNIQYDLQKTTGTCPPKLSLNNSMLVAQQEIYYIDPNTKKRVVVLHCHETDQLTAIPDSMIIKKYAECPVFWNPKTLKVVKQYRKYVKLDGQTETKISDCVFDPAKTYNSQWDYSKCSVRVDTVAGKVRELAKAYYNDGAQDHYVSDCVETGTLYAIKDNHNICQPIKLANPTKVILQKRLYYNDRLGIVTWLGQCEPSLTVDSGKEKLCASSPINYNDNVNQAFLNTKWIYQHGASEIELVSCNVKAQRPSSTYTQRLCGWQHARASSYGERGYSKPKIESYIQFPQTSLNVLLDANVVGTKKYIVPTKKCDVSNIEVNHSTRHVFAKYWHQNFFRIINQTHTRQVTSSIPITQRYLYAKVNCSRYAHSDSQTDYPYRMRYYYPESQTHSSPRRVASCGAYSDIYKTKTVGYTYHFSQTNEYEIQCGSRFRKAIIYSYPTNYNIAQQSSSSFGNDYDHIKLDAYAKTKWGTSFKVYKSAGSSSFDSRNAHLNSAPSPSNPSLSNLCNTSKIEGDQDSYGNWRVDNGLDGKRN